VVPASVIEAKAETAESLARLKVHSGGRQPRRLGAVSQLASRCRPSNISGARLIVRPAAGVVLARRNGGIEQPTRHRNGRRARLHVPGPQPAPLTPAEHFATYWNLFWVLDDAQLFVGETAKALDPLEPLLKRPYGQLLVTACSCRSVPNTQREVTGTWPGSR
jgi:hypothetical protein